MNFQLAIDGASKGRYLSDFLTLAGESHWRKRVAQLASEVACSPAQAKIIADYHWLELATDGLMMSAAAAGDFPSPDSLDGIAALNFASMIVECHQRLDAAARTTLEGRVRAALQAETGFAALYLEMDMARRLLHEDFEIGFPDLEGYGQWDLEFAKADITGEIECKSLSADAGRKVHRKDFYRYIDAVGRDLVSSAEAGGDDIFLIVLDDRLPAATAQQIELRAATARLAREATLVDIRGSFFTIRRESYAEKLGASQHRTQREFYSACCDTFGKDCHVSGVATERGVCLVVMRSCKEDDYSKPWLEATEKAATQFSGTRPAFIAMQFNDIEPADLISPHLRRRAEILSGALFFRNDKVAHVVGVFFCPYGGLVGAANGVGAPAFSILNPRARFPVQLADYSPLLGSVPDEEFSRLLGVAKV